MIGRASNMRIPAAALLAALLFSSAGARPSAAQPMAQVPPFLEAGRITPRQFAGAVSFAMESMRLVYGEMTPEQEKRFEGKWRPLFQHCTPAVIAYFNKLNPLLGRFLGIRAAMSETMAAFDAAQFEALVAYTVSDPKGGVDPEGPLRALAEAELCRLQLVCLQRALADVVGKILAQGDPPNGEAETARRHKRHEEALRVGSGRGAGSCVRLSWKEPPAGWCETARWPGNPGCLPIRSDDDRHLYLNPEESKLEFLSSEDPGRCEIRIALRFAPFPEIADIEEGVRSAYDDLPKDPPERRRLLGDYHTRAGGIFGHTLGKVPTRFTVEASRLFQCPAVRTETHYVREIDPAGGDWLRTRNVRVVWYAVDIGLAKENCWLSVQVEMELTDTFVDRIPDDLKYVKPAEVLAFGRKRGAARWDTLKAIWEREVWWILDSMEVALEKQMPEGEARRFTAREGTRPSPEVWAARGCPQALNNGMFVCLAETGNPGQATLRQKAGMSLRVPRKNPKPGQSPTMDSGASVMMRSDHSWTEPPRELRWGQPYTAVVDCSVGCTLESECGALSAGTALNERSILSSADAGAVTVFDTGLAPLDGPEGSRLEMRTDRPVPCTDPGTLAKVRKEFRYGVSRERALHGNWLRIAVRSSLGDNRSGGEQGLRELYYVYDWMPVRKTGPASAGGAVPRRPEPDAAAEAEKRAKLGQIEFYVNEIRLRQESLAWLQNQLSQATPAQRAELQRQMMWAEDWIQRAQDAITTLQTGVYTRTRTAADAYNLSVMAAQSRDMAQKWSAINGLVRRGPHLIALAPPGEQARLRKFFDEQTRPESMASGDTDKFRKVVRILGNRVMGSLEGDQARAQLTLIDAEERLQRAENLKTVCEVELMILSMGGGSLAYVQTAYQGVTGYLEGGIGEAAKQVLSSYNTATQMAGAAMDAYQQGVVDAYAKYAKDPMGGPVDELRAGLISAGWAVGKQAAMELAAKFVAEPLLKKALGIPDPPRKKTLQELSQEMQYLKRRAEGMDTVALFKERLGDVARAAKAGAPAAALDKLQAEADQVYRLIKTDYFAKLHLNELARKGSLDLLKQYNACDAAAMQRLRERFGQRMAGDGFGAQEYKLFSNSASAGKAGMDVDLGVVEPPRFTFDADGNKIPNPARQAWLDSLTRPGPDGKPVRIGLHDLREAGQRNLEEAFRDVFGYDPRRSAGREAFVNFTTSDHPEAYRDLAWLGKKGMKTADLENIDPAWVGQAADVTGFKADSLPHHHPAFGYFATLQEQCRGTVKDFDTKLMPMLGRSTNEVARQHMRDLRDVMDRFARNEIGPIEANDRILQLTGGRGIAEVIEQYRTMLTGLAGAK